MKYIVYLFVFLWMFHCSTQQEPQSKTALSKAEDPMKFFKITQFDTLPEKRNLFASHYPISNEMRIDLFMEYIQNLGGGYIGVGTDQNLSFVAKAKSEYVWLMDFDPYVVGVNKIHILFLTLAENYEDFKNLWSIKNKKKSFEEIEKRYSKDPDYTFTKGAWDIALAPPGVPSRLKDLDFMSKKYGLVSFHNTPEEYTYLRKLALDGKIQAIPGDLTGSVSIQNIAKAAESMGVKIRIMYTSNAEEYTPFPAGYRKNIISLPTDEKSVLIRTITSYTKSVFGFPEGEGERFPDYPFHYNVQPINNFKLWLGLNTKIGLLNLLKTRTQIKKGLSIQKTTPTESGMKESGDINKYAD